METVQLGIYHLPYDVVSDRTLLEKHIYTDMKKNYYWSDDFSAVYYIAQAKAGFIAVTDYFEEEELLLPEIQFAYALLDFEDLHISRNVARLLEHRSFTLLITDDLDEAASGIRWAHVNNWMTPRYLEILKETQGKEANFKVVSVLLQEDGRTVAGEIGYIIGETYTSLSGFRCKEKHCNHYGTVQLVLLAQHLQKEGFAFWNLGQPYMDYKFALGAKVYERPVFLKRWFKHTRKNP